MSEVAKDIGDQRPQESDSRPVGRRILLKSIGTTVILGLSGGLVVGANEVAKYAKEASNRAYDSGLYPCYTGFIDRHPVYIADQRRIRELEYDLLAALTPEDKSQIRADLQRMLEKRDTDVQKIYKCGQDSETGGLVVPAYAAMAVGVGIGLRATYSRILRPALRLFSR